MKNMLFDRNVMMIDRRWNSRFTTMLEATPEKFSEAANNKMYDEVKHWWDSLPENLQVAIRAFKFSRTLITGQMFFADTPDVQDFGGFGSDYMEFAHALLTYIMELAHNPSMEDRVRNDYGVLWSMAREVLSFETLYDKRLAEYTEYASRIKSNDLRKEVIHDLLWNDHVLVEQDEYFTNRLNGIRKQMLEYALERLARENGM